MRGPAPTIMLDGSTPPQPAALGDAQADGAKPGSGKKAKKAGRA
jgi:hypothetical protein